MTEDHVFITGAAGYVGRNLLRHFIAKGHRVTGLVRNEEAARRVASWGGEPVLGDMLTAVCSDTAGETARHRRW